MDLSSRIELIKHPEKIKEALFASSPTVLKFAFDGDPNVRAIIAEGGVAFEQVSKVMSQKTKELHDISLSCYAFILSKIDIHRAAKTFQPIFIIAADRPGSFAAMFMAQALRLEKNLPINTYELYYTPDQIRETLKSIEGERR